MLAAADKDGGGDISYEEFRMMIGSTLAKQ